MPGYILTTDPAGPPSPPSLQQSPPRDSLKNGAITGAVTGAVAGTLMAALVCQLGEELDGETPDEFSCPGPAAVLIGTGTVLGAAIGIGVDALFERAPSAHLPAGGRRTVFRLRLKF